MDIQLIEYIGQIKNDTEQLGKAYLFNIVLNKYECNKFRINSDIYKFDVILFMHVKKCFVSLHDEEIKLGIDKDYIYNSIIDKYTKEELI